MPQRDRSPLRFTWSEDAKEFANVGDPVRALVAHRNLTGFEGMAIAGWCRENIGTEGVSWGRSTNYGWWFHNEQWATQFLIVFQCSLPATMLED
jgi:hypothetical protein